MVCWAALAGATLQWIVASPSGEINRAVLILLLAMSDLGGDLASEMATSTLGCVNEAAAVASTTSPGWVSPLACESAEVSLKSPIILTEVGKLLGAKALSVASEVGVGVGVVVRWRLGAC